MPHNCPRQREDIKRLKKKSSVKTENWTEPERKTKINIGASLVVEGAAGFVRTQE